MGCVFEIYRRCRNVRLALLVRTDSRTDDLGCVGPAVRSDPADAVEATAFDLRAETLQRWDRHALLLRRCFGFDRETTSLDHQRDSLQVRHSLAPCIGVLTIVVH